MYNHIKHIKLIKLYNNKIAHLHFHNFFLSLSLSPCINIDFTESLRLTEVRIPNHVIRNNTVRLECHFDMNGESLYSVKWYKDGYEFYRYVPRDHPPAQIFEQNGVYVNVSENNFPFNMI